MKPIAIRAAALLMPLMMLTAAGCVTSAAAQGIPRMKARNFLKRTSAVILHAHRAVKKNKVYTGDLARSIAHQKLARRLFMANKLLRAVHHSRRARLLAIRAIRANKGMVKPDFGFTQDEEQMFGQTPSDDELDTELAKEMPGESLKDEEVIGTEPDVDIKDEKAAPGWKE